MGNFHISVTPNSFCLKFEDFNDQKYFMTQSRSTAHSTLPSSTKLKAYFDSYSLFLPVVVYDDLISYGQNHIKIKI